MTYRVPTGTALNLEEFHITKVDEEKLRGLLRTLFKHESQTNFAFEFINQLQRHISINYPKASAHFRQPQTEGLGRASFFLPGRFEVNVIDIGNKIDVDGFPIPDRTQSITFLTREVSADNLGNLRLKYVFELVGRARNSVSVKPTPLPERDRSPQRDASFSSSPSPEKPKGFFSTLTSFI